MDHHLHLTGEAEMMEGVKMVAMWAPTKTTMDVDVRDRERRMEQEPLQELELQVPLALQTAVIYGRGPRRPPPPVSRTMNGSRGRR